MDKSVPLIRSLSLVNLNGITARTLDLVELEILEGRRRAYPIYGNTVSLLGENGAGKTTILGAFQLGLIADLRYVALGTSDRFKKVQQLADSEMYARLGNPCIVALEVQTRELKRHLYVIYAVKSNNKSLSVTRLRLKLPEKLEPMNCLARRSGKHWQVNNPDQIRELAAQFGCELTSYESAEAYLLDLFHDGILPKPLQKDKDRMNLAQIFHSAMSGRLDESIERNLSSFLMTSARGNIKDVVDVLENSMRTIRGTQIELENNLKDYQFFRDLLALSATASAYAWAVAEKQLQIDDASLNAVQGKLTTAKQAFEEVDAQVKCLVNEMEISKRKRNDLEIKRQQIDQQWQLASQAAREFTQREFYQERRREILPQNKAAAQEYAKAKKQYQEIADASAQAAQSLAETQEELANAVQAYDGVSRKAGLYVAACKQLAKVESFLGNVVIESLPSSIADFEQKKDASGRKLNDLERQLQQMEAITDAYQNFHNQLKLLGEEVSVQELQGWVTHKRAELQQLQKQVAALPYEQKNLGALQQDKEMQTHYWDILHSLLLQEIPRSEVAFLQTLAFYHQQQRDVNEALLQQQEQRDALAIEVQKCAQECEKVANKHQTWLTLQTNAEQLRSAFPEREDWSQKGCMDLRQYLSTERGGLAEKIASCRSNLIKTKEELDKLQREDAGNLEGLRSLSDEINGVPICDLYADIEPEEARYFEAALGELSHGILVADPDAAARDLLAEYGEDWPLEDLLLIPCQAVEAWRAGKMDRKSLFQDVTENFVGVDANAQPPWCVILSESGMRISQLRETPILGDKARGALIQQKAAAITALEAAIKEAENQLSKINNTFDALNAILPQANLAFSEEPDVEAAEAKWQAVDKDLQSVKNSIKLKTQEKNNIEKCVSGLEKCRASVKLLYRDVDNEILASQAKVDACDRAARECQRFAALFDNFEERWKLLFEPYPMAAEKLQEVVNLEHTTYAKFCEELRSMQSLYQDRFHLAPQYAEAKALLDDRTEMKKTLRNRAQQLKNEKVRIEGLEKAAKKSYEEAQEKSNRSVAQLELIEQEIGKSEKALSDIDINYVPGLENQLQEQKGQLEAETSAIQKQVEEKNVALNKARENRVLKSNEVDKYVQAHIETEAQYEKSGRIRQAVKKHIDEDRTASVLQDEMAQMLQKIRDTSTAIPQLSNRINKVNAYLQENSIPANDPMYEFGSHLISDISYPNAVHLYAEAVKLFKRRVRQDLIHSGEPQQMLIELEESCQRAQKTLEQAERDFETKRGELGDAIFRRIRGERRAVTQLSQQLRGIGFGQVEEVQLVTEYASKFEEILNVLRNGSQQMEDLFSNVKSVEEALAELYHRTTAGEIKGEKLLDHRNYLQVKTQIRRKGHREFEDLEGTQLSTGERLGSGLAVLVSIIKYWATHAYGKSSFAVPLVMDEVSRLDARSQATVAELCRRCGVQLLMAAPESIGKISGLGYQLVRVAAEKSTSQASEGNQSWVQITGLQDSAELTVDAESIINELAAHS